MLATLLFAIGAHNSLCPSATISRPLEGFVAEQTGCALFRNPTEAIDADPRFEPEQIDPSITIEWTRAADGHLWADVVLRNPDFGKFAAKNERIELAQAGNGDWQIVGRWSRWKCIGYATGGWTTEACA